MAQEAAHESILEKLEDVGMSLREIDENVRQSIFNLREIPHDNVDIQSRFQSYLTRPLDGANIEWSLIFPDDAKFGLNEQIQLFGMMQELVTHVIKHASATKITVSVQQSADDPTKWMFQVSDNGVGLNGNEQSDRKFGIDIVYSRARKVGAQVHVESTNSGVTVTVKPIEVEHDVNDVPAI